jgi:hypothetical protein
MAAIEKFQKNATAVEAGESCCSATRRRMRVRREILSGA